MCIRDRSTKITIVSSELGLDYNMKPLQIILAAFAGENAQAWGAPNTFGQGGGGADYTQAGGPLNYTAWALYPEVIYNMGAMSLGLYAGIGGQNTSGTGINYKVEPYVKLNDFGLRVSFLYAGSSASGSTAIWEIPIIVDWGF